MRATGCDILIGDKTRIWPAVLEYAKTFVEMRSLDYWLDGAEVPSYPSDRIFNKAADQSSVILHTTGTTGVPKPISMKNSFWAQLENVIHLEGLPGRTILPQFEPGSRRIFIGFPLFHASSPR